MPGHSQQHDGTTPGTNYKLEIARLQAEFSEMLAERFREIERLWNDYLLEFRDADLLLLHEKVRSLAGSSATFGFADISAMAHAFEVKLEHVLAADQAPGFNELHSMRSLFGSFKHTVGSQRQANVPVTKPISSIDDAPHAHRVEMIYVVEPKKNGNLTDQLRSFGYRARHFSDLDDLSRTVRKVMPAAFVVECPDPGPSLSRLDEMLAERDDSSRPPLLVIAPGEDFSSRLAAARAGAQAYFPESVSTTAVVDKLDELLVGGAAEPNRILIIDDDTTLSRVYELIFQEQGWITRVLNDPMGIMQVMEDFSPDIILMDLYMPGVNGTELSRVIRQIDAFVSIPIVYLSSEENLDKQLQAVSTGADDFLCKTMRPDHLVAAVESRARRYRTLRSLLSRDGLTGLLNHTNFMLGLENELSRTKRIARKLAVAMIDLDHFKTVNDTYGHMVGDQVLKSLTKLLRQSLRKSDLVGRYGGEEFAVALLDLESEEDAVSTLDKIRQAFSRLRHKAGENEFSVTLSCGMAVYPDFATESDLMDAADKALYEAKRGGRNRVVRAAAG